MALDVLLLFKSTHTVMKAEEYLERKNIRAKLTPIPSSIRADCGIGILTDRGDIKGIRDVLNREGILEFRAYIKNVSGRLNTGKGRKNKWDPLQD